MQLPEPSIYTRILQGQLEPILYEDTDWFVLASDKPYNEGHLLLIPKLQTRKFFQLPPDILQAGFALATKLSIVLDELYHPPEVMVLIKGFSVPDHVHIHLIPGYTSTDTDMDFTKIPISAEEKQRIAQKLLPHIQAALG